MERDMLQTTYAAVAKRSKDAPPPAPFIPRGPRTVYIPPREIRHDQVMTPYPLVGVAEYYERPLSLLEAGLRALYVEMVTKQPMLGMCFFRQYLDIQGAPLACIDVLDSVKLFGVHCVWYFNNQFTCWDTPARICAMAEKVSRRKRRSPWTTSIRVRESPYRRILVDEDMNTPFDRILRPSERDNAGPLFFVCQPPAGSADRYMYY
jgi:hypothetical protein